MIGCKAEVDDKERERCSQDHEEKYKESYEKREVRLREHKERCSPVALAT